ncbi:hypothetical protein V8F33_004369 [Rhypophila sp. PSN 637]
MSGSQSGTPKDFMSAPSVGNTPKRGANLFSPTGSEGTHERARSILPGVQPREGSGSSTYSNRRGRRNYGPELTEEAAPVFGMAGQSSRSSGRSSVPSTPRDQMGHDVGTDPVSPSTAALMRQLQAMYQKVHTDEAPEDVHPAVQDIQKTAADVVDKIWKLRATAKTDEAVRVMDVNLMAITGDITTELAAAKKLAEQLQSEKQRTRELEENAAHTRDELARMSRLFEEQTAMIEQSSRESARQINDLTIRVKKAEENELRLIEMVRGLKNQEAARDNSIKSLSEGFGGKLNLGSPAPAHARDQAAAAYGSGRLSSFALPAPAPSTVSRGSARTGLAAPRTNLRPSAKEFQQQVVASASSAERRLDRPADRPSGASDFGSPQPKRSSLVLMAPPRVESEELQMWRDLFQEFFGTVRKYTATYWKHAPRDLASTLQNDAAGWQQLLKAAHPTNPEAAQAFVTRLVSERPSVPFLVERIIIQFVVQEVFCFDAWLNWDAASDQQWSQIKQRLSTTDFSDPITRLAIIDERITIINQRLTHSKWPEWKSYRQSVGFQKLRTIVAPIAAPLKDKKEAIYDLFSIVEDAWELSVKVMNSRLSFSYDFPMPGESLTNDVQNVLNTYANDWSHQQYGGSSSSALVHRGGAGGAVSGAGLFIVTPRVIMRDERVPGAQATLVVKPDVLLRQ